MIPTFLALAAGAAAPGVRQGVPPSERGPTRVRAAPHATSYPAAAAGDGPSASGFNPSRWAEDWRALADPAKRDDPLDRLKFLPVAGDGAVYLTLSGEARARINAASRADLAAPGSQRQDILRLVGGADLHLGSYVRAYGELAHGGLDGVREGANPILRNDLIVQQAFVEANAPVAGVVVGGRYGRQEFTDASALLVSTRDNNTIRTVFNGARGWVRGAWWRADLFDFHPTRYGIEGTGDDRRDRARRFSGATFGLVVPPAWTGGTGLYLDPFLWRLRTDATGATEVRRYAGARLWGDVGRVTLDWSANRQGGHLGDRRIAAWQAFAAQTVRLGKPATAPRIGIHLDYASGGGGGAGRVERAVSPAPNAIYYNYQALLSPSNLIAVAPNLTVSPLRRLRLTGEVQWTWRADARDAVYRANGSPYAGTERVADRRLAEMARLQLVYTVSPRVSFTGRLEHLAAGPSLTRAGYRGSDFAAGWINLRF